MILYVELENMIDPSCETLEMSVIPHVKLTAPCGTGQRKVPLLEMTSTAVLSLELENVNDSTGHRKMSSMSHCHCQ